MLTSIQTWTLLFSSDAKESISQPFYSVRKETKQSTNCDFNKCCFRLFVLHVTTTLTRIVEKYIFAFESSFYNVHG